MNDKEIRFAPIKIALHSRYGVFRDYFKYHDDVIKCPICDYMKVYEEYKKSSVKKLSDIVIMPLNIPTNVLLLIN